MTTFDVVFDIYDYGNNPTGFQEKNVGQKKTGQPKKIALPNLTLNYV